MTDATEGHRRCSHVPFHLLREASSCVCVNIKLNTKRPPDNLGEPVPIYIASRWCLSVVWQERVLSNCVKPHIVMMDKEGLLRSWYKVRVRPTKDCDVSKWKSWHKLTVCIPYKTHATHMCKQCFQISPLMPQLFYATKKEILSLKTQTELCSTKHQYCKTCTTFFFPLSFFVKSFFLRYIP